jgi:hypothetical protein
MSPSLPDPQVLLSFAALQDRRTLLLGYVKNDVVTQDKFALLRTIETACGSSLSRAPETHPVLLHLLSSPPVGRTASPFFKSWPWLVPRYALLADALELRTLRGCGARSHAGQYVRFPRSARPSHSLRQQSLASNPCEYDKAPKVKAFGNKVRQREVRYLNSRPRGDTLRKKLTVSASSYRSCHHRFLRGRDLKLRVKNPPYGGFFAYWLAGYAGSSDPIKII